MKPRRSRKAPPLAMPAAAPVRILDARIVAEDDMGTLVRVDYIDGSYRIERFPPTTTPKRARRGSA